MKQYLSKRISMLAGLLLCSILSYTQDSSVAEQRVKLFSGTHGYRTWSIGVHGGMLIPALSIGGRNDFSKWKPTLGYGVYLKNQISHRFGLQGEFLRGMLKATNERPIANGSPQPGPYASFSTELHWSSALTGILTVGNIHWSQSKTHVQPYFKLGAGLVNYNPTLVTNSGTEINYKPGGSITELFLPVGFGFKFNVANNVNIDLGYTMNFVDGDNLDGYFKPPYAGDKFSYSHLGLEFVLGNKSKPVLARHNAPAALAKDLKEDNDAMRASLAANAERMNQMKQELARAGMLKDEIERLKADSDKDGVADHFDKCPGTPAGVQVDGAGCPLPVAKDTVIKQQTQTFVITEEDRRIISEAIKNLEFDFAKATIRPRSFPSLNRVAEILVKKGFSLKLAGHTDYIGSDAFNLRLSKARAESVKEYLVSQGANPSRIEAVGYGESQPIATNKTAAGRQKNRRVEFTLY